MINFKLCDYLEIENSDLLNQIISFDRLNMKTVLRDAELEFNEDKRRSFFNNKETFVIAMENNNIIGYLEYGFNSKASDEIYITSLQITEEYRKSSVCFQLLSIAIHNLRNVKFLNFTGNVHKTNIYSIDLYKKFGFDITEIEGNQKQFKLSADSSILYCNRVNTIYTKFYHTTQNCC